MIENTKTREAPEGYIHEAQFSKLLGVTVRTARKWRANGNSPPYVKVGKSFFYPTAELHRWLAKRTQGAER